MYRRQYKLRLLAKVSSLLVAPLLAYAIVIGQAFPPNDFWGYFFWALGIAAGWMGFLAGIAQLLGSSLPQWIGWDLLRVDSAFEKTTQRTLWSIRDTLPVLDRRIPRTESELAWSFLEDGRPVLITGEGGSGKSGIAASVVRKAQESGIPVLFLDTRNYSSTVSSFGDLEHYVGVKIPLRDCLESVAAGIGNCLLVVDQLDSAVGTPALQVSTELLAQAASGQRVYVVAVSCLLDNPEYQAITDLRFEVLRSNSIPADSLIDILRMLGVHHPSAALLALSDNLFNLSLVAQLSEQGMAKEATREAALLEELTKALTTKEGFQFTETAEALAQENLKIGLSDFPIPRDLRGICQRLQNRGIVVPAPGGRYRFRHEQLLYYFFARAMVEGDVEPAAILVRLAGLHAEQAFVWVVRLYRYRRSEHLAGLLQGILQVDSDLAFYEKASVLDEVLTWEDVDTYPRGVDAIARSLLADSSLERYFFRHLAASGNVGWFEPLRERRFFDAAPWPIRAESTVRYPFWPALSYLAAVAPLASNAVVEVAQKLESRDPFTLLELVRAAQTMPPQSAADMVPEVVRWTKQGLKIETSTVSLARFLSRAEQWKAALALADLVMSPQEEHVPDDVRQSPFFTPRATSRAEDYALRAFVESELAFFVEHRPVEVLRIVQRNLETVVSIHSRDGSDASRWWRPAIETHEQNEGDNEFVDLLVDAAVQALVGVSEQGPVEARAILEEYLEHRFSIFVRLAIHSIRLHSGLWPDLLERLFVDPRYLEDPDVHHEYWLLMRDACGQVQRVVRDSFIARLFGRLPQKEMKGSREYDQQRYWVLRQLWAIDPDLLRQEQQGVVRKLVEEYGPPQRPDFLSYSYTSSGWVTPRSPTDLTRLSAEGALAELRKPLPFSSLDDPSMEGLAKALKEAVESTPERFAAVAPDLFGADIPPLYTYHVIWGFQEAWKTGKLFDWGPVLTLCQLVSRTVVEAKESASPADLDPDYWEGTYASARTSVADLLQAGVARDEHAIPPEYLPQVRDILLTLSDDLNPTREYEVRWSGDYPRRVLDLALNVTRGRAVEALIQYALHFARLDKQQQGEGQEPQPPQSRMETIVKDKLTEKLDKEVDSSLAVHSLFGKYLPNLHYLDQGWLIAHLEDIFPRQALMADYWEAAWEGYLFRGDLFGYLYEFLRPYYHYALDQMGLAEEGKAGSEFARGRLARHLAALYWRGVETLETEDSLLPMFFHIASDELRASFVRGLETGLAEVAPAADSQEWHRAKALWITRAQAMKEVAERKGNLEGFLQEVGAYAGWIPHVPLEEFDNLFPLIEVSVRMCDSHQVHEVIEFLPSVLPEHTGLAMRLLEGVVEQSRDRWFMATEHKAIQIVLEAAMHSNDEDTARSAVRVINRFGERGDERYRSLLQ